MDRCGDCIRCHCGADRVEIIVDGNGVDLGDDRRWRVSAIALDTDETGEAITAGLPAGPAGSTDATYEIEVGDDASADEAGVATGPYLADSADEFVTGHPR